VQLPRAVVTMAVETIIDGLGDPLQEAVGVLREMGAIQE
jgi:hypothetical protein